MSDDPDRQMVLIPYVAAEACSVREAAKIAGRSVGTIRNWIKDYGIGRRVGPMHLMASRVALKMYMDNDRAALAEYHSGVRLGGRVAAYIIDHFQIDPDFYRED